MREVDLTTWQRRERYEFFKGLSWPFWSVSFPVDVTGLHRWSHDQGHSFYYALVYLCTKALEDVEAFHYRPVERASSTMSIWCPASPI